LGEDQVHFSRIIRRLFRKYKTNDPFAIAEYLNISIWFVQLDEHCRGFALRTLRRKYIAINCELSNEEQRLVCAHELGHLLLHKGLGYYFIDRETLLRPGKYERQANQFAVQLLIQGSLPEPDEPINWFLSRCGIPEEMHQFYSPHF
jgi:Zn-dependent peptidase ImmA (M78 family)